MQVDFKGANSTNYRFSTETVITPNTWPYPPCYGEDCYGTLL